MKTRLLITALGSALFLLATVAHSAEIWKFKRIVDDFDDAVSHSASDGGNAMAVICGSQKTLSINFSAPESPSASTITVLDVRVDKKPYQEFLARWFRGVATLAAGESLGIGFSNWLELRRFIYGLMQGTKLIYRQELSDTVTISLAGSAKAIGKVLEACDVNVEDARKVLNAEKQREVEARRQAEAERAQTRTESTVDVENDAAAEADAGESAPAETAAETDASHSSEASVAALTASTSPATTKSTNANSWGNLLDTLPDLGIRVADVDGETVYTTRAEAEETLDHFADWLGIGGPAKLRALNELRYGRAIVIGQQLRLPVENARMAERFERRRTDYHQVLSESLKEHYNLTGIESYTVQPGDSAWELSTRLRFPVWLLYRLNPILRTAQLKPGQQLTLPKLSERY